MQVPDPLEVINGPSPDEEDDVRFSDADAPADDKLEEEKLEQEELEEERKRLREFYDAILLNVTSMMNFIVHR